MLIAIVGKIALRRFCYIEWLYWCSRW